MAFRTIIEKLNIWWTISQALDFEGMLRLGNADRKL